MPFGLPDRSCLNPASFRDSNFPLRRISPSIFARMASVRHFVLPVELRAAGAYQACWCASCCRSGKWTGSLSEKPCSGPYPPAHNPQAPPPQVSVTMCTRGPSKNDLLAFSTLMGPSLVMEILEGICGMSVPESRFPAISPWGSSCPEPEDGEDGGCPAGVSYQQGSMRQSQRRDPIALHSSQSWLVHRTL